MLGTCARCGAWYLIEVGKGKTGAFMFDLPNVTLVHAATAPSGTKSPRKRPPKRMAGNTIDFTRTTDLVSGALVTRSCAVSLFARAFFGLPLLGFAQASVAAQRIEERRLGAKPEAPAVASSP